MSSVLTVSQINTYLKAVLDGDDNLQHIFVCGEISNFTNHYRTGHFYFTLKDEKAAIKAVMFRSAAQRLRFLPENGMRVIIRGSVSLFERDGVYQLYCDDMQPDGAGAPTLTGARLGTTVIMNRFLSEPFMYTTTHPSRTATVNVWVEPLAALPRACAQL